MTASPRSADWEPSAAPERAVLLRALRSGAHALRGVLDLAGVPTCAACKAPSDRGLCDDCLRRCQPVPGPVCVRCGSAPSGRDPREPCGRCTRFGRPFAFERALVPWLYRGPVRRAVLALKFGGRRDLGPRFGRWLSRWPTVSAWTSALPGALVVGVPARRQARRERGYDQALLLARGLARGAGLSFSDRALRRRREPPQPQAGRPLAERRAGPRAGFAARPALVAGRSVLLVDDVLSSGATVDAAARALRCAGAARVLVVALAT
jgi:predicted amidophosphoribosyltransferase